MANNTINIEALAEKFKVECKIIKLGYEYPGYTGTEKYAIVTDLSYAQIMERYSTTFSMSGMRLRQAKKSVRFGRIKRQTVSVSVPPSHLDMSETHRTRRTGW